MSGSCGWCGLNLGQQSSEILGKMAKRLCFDGNTDFSSAVYQDGGLATISTDRNDKLYNNDEIFVAIDGHPYFSNSKLQDDSTSQCIAKIIADLFREKGTNFLRSLMGDFSLVIIHKKSNEALLAIDAMGIQPMSYCQINNSLIFASNTDSILSHPSVTNEVDPQSIYNYLYFSMIPSPQTVYKGIHKLEPAQYLHFRNHSLTTGFYWHPSFTYTTETNLEVLGEELLDILKRTVKRYNLKDDAGAFLSGGLDSSTVSGVLSRVYDTPAKTYSIGFDADGYDEIEYARIAAKHFDTCSNEYYVTKQNVASALPVIASNYDEPFGNSSALPAYYCAQLAKKDGTNILLAGDGGDEIFAGNERYSKQKVFEIYSSIPSVIRKLLIEPTINYFPLAGKIPPIKKIDSYIRQANIPLPERLETYNFLSMVSISDIFTPDFIKLIDEQHPINMQKEVFHRADTSSVLNKMLFLDWKFTLADNDLRKVNRMCEVSGVDVLYPMLDNELVEFSNKIPPNIKLKGHQLRYFFKKTMEGFLPDAILKKPKQGFGLPFGVWLKESSILNDMLLRNMGKFKKRGYIKPDYIDWLMGKHKTEHAGFYGTMLWMLMMLENWLSEHNY